MPSSIRRMILVVPSMVMFLLMPSAASGHAPGQFYDAYWIEDPTVRWKFVSDFPGGNFRERLKDGAKAWNDLNQFMKFSFVSGDYDPYPPATCSPNEQYQKDGIHWGPISDPDTLAWTATCSVTYPSGLEELWSFNIKFDQGRNWYTGIGNTPNGEFDLWSVATHEFGHATGWDGHFGDATQFCTDSPKHTMCPSIGNGASHWRSLEEHDKHTFRDAY